MFENLKGISSGLHLWVLIIYLFLSCAVPMGIHSSKPFKLLLNFDDLDRSGRWMVVNDGVMGESLVRILIFIQKDIWSSKERFQWSMEVVLLL